LSLPIPPTAIDWNNFFNVIGYTAVIAVAITIGAMIIFTIKYRERMGKRRFIPQQGLHVSRARDAVIFASISITILLTMSILSFTLTPNARFLPSSPATEIKVIAYQWGFTFVYPNGANSTGVVHVPENATIVFNVTSIDVMHNFYLPDFRVSIDAIPGRYNAIWVSTPLVGSSSELSYRIICKELCGVGHTFMFATLIVTTLDAYNQYIANQTTAKGT
jgi:Heme/copper-type cytochrome/quinol oxidases, subunit 2